MNDNYSYYDIEHLDVERAGWPPLAPRSDVFLWAREMITVTVMSGSLKLIPYSLFFLNLVCNAVLSDLS